ncbi:MAG: hypothetical protein DWH79_00310 [Planctomycetota bacterium]|nr:MAG: hypothetical protein DWH79_00310 [Planctomycetota bacterium]
MPATPITANTRPASHAATFVVNVGGDQCTVRATGVRSIADVLAAPGADVLGFEEMEALGAIDEVLPGECEVDPVLASDVFSAGMISAPRIRRRQRAVSSRALFFGAPRG